jgi:hypothetical protein
LFDQGGGGGETEQDVIAGLGAHGFFGQFEGMPLSAGEGSLEDLGPGRGISGGAVLGGEFGHRFPAIVTAADTAGGLRDRPPWSRRQDRIGKTPSVEPARV